MTRTLRTLTVADLEPGHVIASHWGDAEVVRTHDLTHLDVRNVWVKFNGQTVAWGYGLRDRVEILNDERTTANREATP